MRPRALATALILCALLGLGTSAAQGELGATAGIGVDVEIARILDEIEAGTARQDRVSEELAVLRQRQAHTKDALKSRVRALYRVTRAGMTPLAGGFDAVRKHVARVRRLSGFVRSDTSELRRIEARKSTLQSEASSLTAELTHARARLTALQDSGAADPGDGFMQVLAQSGSPAPREGGSFYGIRFSDEGESAPQDGFEALRGKLASPVAGEVRVVDARRDESDGPGLELQAPVGTAVRAAASGRVAFSDRYGSYGRLVILDHGDGYYTAYGGLGAVEVRVGDDLSANARIGAIGGESSPPSLFFEVRKGTRTLPPRTWLGL